MPTMSLATAELLNYIANIVLIVSLIAGVFSTYTIVATGNIKESHLNQKLAQSIKAGEQAKKDAAEANLKTEQAKLDRDKLKSEMSWRGITEDQITKMRSSFPVPHPPLNIWLQYSEIDPEARQYAEQIAQAINSREFKITPTGFTAWGGETGLSISPNEGSTYIVDAFAAAGIETEVSEAYPNGSAEGQVVIQVGSKPRPSFNFN